MKKFFVLSGVAALAACSPGETEAPATDDTAVMEAEVPAGFVAAGNYVVSRAEESSSAFTMNDDGTFSGSRDGEEYSGSYAYTDGKICFTGPEEGAETECWTNSEVAEDGSFTSVSDTGEEVSLTVAAAE